MGAYKDKNGTWFASARYKNWAGETKRKMKRGFPTKREALLLGTRIYCHERRES